MPRFFINDNPKINDEFLIEGEDAKHIAKSLRMQKGETVTLCNPRFSTDFKSEIVKVEEDTVCVLILDKSKNISERDTTINLYQCVPKSDKMEDIIKMGTEVGINSFTPVISQFCISRPDEKSAKKKVERFNKKAESAAKQSGRGTIPKINKQLDFKEAVDKSLKDNEVSILFYENSDRDLNFADFNFDKNKTVGIFIGSEGGFSEEEVSYANDKGVTIASLGNRILRTETAPIVAVTIIATMLGDL